MPVIHPVSSVNVGKNCETTSTNCIECDDGKALVSTGLRNYCADVLGLEKGYFVVSLSTLYVKFSDKLNNDIKLESFEGFLVKSEKDYEAHVAGTLPKSEYVTFSFDKDGYRIYQTHLIFKVNMETQRIDGGVFILIPKESRFVNSTGEAKLYADKTIVVRNIHYFRSSASSFEGVLGMIVGIVLGLNGFIALFIPAIKFTIMSMKVFQMNNYFFLINVNLPVNLFLFFENIQFGNIFKQLEQINPLSFMANDTCKEFQDKLLALNKTCQLFKNAGPHMFLFGISGIIKLILEGYQRLREKQGQPRGKLYEFLKLKFGTRFFIELLNYFHMDLVMYNLMNLMFSEMDNFTTFFNLLMSVVLMVFFIYFYIMMFVIVSKYSSDFLLTSLCDPLNKLGTINATPKKDPEEVEPGKGKASTKNLLKSKNNVNEPRKFAEKNGDEKIEENQVKHEEKRSSSWSVKRLFEEVKIKKFKIPKTAEDDEYDRLRDGKTKGVIKVAGKDEKKDDTFEPCNIYRFLFLNSHCMNTYSIHYYPIGFIKEFMLALILVVSYSSGIMQSLVFSCIFTLIYVYNLTMSPLQNQVNNRLLKIYSFLYLLMSYMTFTLNVFDDDVNPALLYYFFGYILIILEIGIIAMIITMTFSEFLKKRRDMKLMSTSGQNKVNPTNYTELRPQVSVNYGKNGEGSKKSKDDDHSKSDIELKRAPTPIRSELSNDSLRKMDFKMPKKNEIGGKFFENKYFDDDQPYDGTEEQTEQVVNNGTKSKSSLVSRKSRLQSKNSKTQTNTQSLSKAEQPNLVMNKGRPVPRRVDSMSDNISLDLPPQQSFESEIKSVSQAPSSYSKKRKLSKRSIVKQ